MYMWDRFALLPVTFPTDLVSPLMLYNHGCIIPEVLSSYLRYLSFSLSLSVSLYHLTPFSFSVVFVSSPCHGLNPQGNANMPYFTGF